MVYNYFSCTPELNKVLSFLVYNENSWMFYNKNFLCEVKEIESLQIIDIDNNILNIDGILPLINWNHGDFDKLKIIFLKDVKNNKDFVDIKEFKKINFIKINFLMYDDEYVSFKNNISSVFENENKNEYETKLKYEIIFSNFINENNIKETKDNFYKISSNIFDKYMYYNKEKDDFLLNEDKF